MKEVQNPPASAVSGILLLGLLKSVLPDKVEDVFYQKIYCQIKLRKNFTKSLLPDKVEDGFYQKLYCQIKLGTDFAKLF
jgi:hypothetical protein